LKAAIFLARAFLFLSLTSTSVYACNCDPPKARKLFSDAKAVFVGQVIEISESTVPLGKEFPPHSYAVRFKVFKYWKGVKGSEITVHSDLGGLPCQQFAFRKGETYLVYAFGRDLISITGCTRSGSIDADYVIEQLKLFGKGKVTKGIKSAGNRAAPPDDGMHPAANQQVFHAQDITVPASSAGRVMPGVGRFLRSRQVMIATVGDVVQRPVMISTRL
jgi:hypothetical protein